MKKIIIIFTLLLTVRCSKENKSTSATSYNVDLSVIYNNSINSYKIDSDGSVIVFMNKKDEIGRVYKSKLNKAEFDGIQNEIYQISKIKCDSTVNHYADGMNYILILKRNNEKTTLISNTCDKYERVDDFVLRLVKMFDKRKKEEFFDSVILPPPPPPQIKE